MFKYGQSYKTVAAMDAFDQGATPKQVPNGQQFECRSKLDDLPNQVGTKGYQIRSHAADYFVAQAVADAPEGSVWQRVASPRLNAQRADAAISDWDVGEGVQSGGHMTGFGDKPTKLKTTIKWGAPVDGVVVGDASWMEATILGPDHPIGSGPSGDGMRNAQELKNATGPEWIGGHLLNHHLGGPGDDVRNIAAIPGTNTNKYHSTKVEQGIKEHINDNGGFAYYRVDVTHESREVPAYGPRPKGNYNVASKLETRWQKLDDAGLPIGPLEVDAFPIPKPTELAAADTTNKGLWHNRPGAEAPPMGTGETEPVTTGTFLGHPTSQPLTCDLADYPNQGLQAVPRSFPHQPYLSPAKLEEFARSVLLKLGRGLPELLVRTETMDATLDGRAFQVNAKRKADTRLGVLETKKPKLRPYDLQNTSKNTVMVEQLIQKLIADIQGNPTGSRARLARGWAIDKEIENDTEAARKDVTMALDPCYDDYIEFMASENQEFDDWLYEQMQ